MSQDAALALLLPFIRAQQRPALWALDEHGAGAGKSAPVPAVAVVSNRLDVAKAMQQSGWQAQFSDYDFSPWAAGSLDAVFFRLAKEKPVVHHVINAAAERLAPGGRLVLSGGKQQGIKTYAQQSALRLGGALDFKKMGKDYLAVITRGAVLGEALDERDYTHLRPTVTDEGLTFYSKPGLYGWDKVDEGSALLVQHLDAFVLSALPRKVFDLGCGYGYLSVHAWRRFSPERIVACDNNAAALLAASRNFAAHAIAGEVVAADCAEGIEESFDLVLCNPPFHQGFDVERDLTERFVAAARRLTAKGGVAAFVTNAFIPLERLARAHFSRVEPVANNGSFKLTRLLP